MKKSYLSKQVIAAIVIATVVIASLLAYFLLLKPLFEAPETVKEPDIYEPLIEGESRAGGSSIVNAAGGGYVYMYTAKESKELQDYTIHAQSGDWAFTVIGNQGVMLKGYESIVLSTNVYYVYYAMRNPIAKHVAPSSEELQALQRKKAEGMSEQELTEAGGWNQLVLSPADIADIEIDYAQYGLSDLEAADNISFVEEDGNVMTLYLGDYTLDGVERYARLDGVNAVYKLDSDRTVYLSATKYDVIPPIVTDVTDEAASGDYILNSFFIAREGVPIVQIEQFDAKDVLAMDRLTKSLIVKNYQTEDGEVIRNLYDTSSEYTLLLMRYFMTSITGSEVLGAVTSRAEEKDGIIYYLHDDMPYEFFEQFGIDMTKPYCYFSTEKYTDATKQDSIMNALFFSAPYEEDGETFYNVYNLFRGVIVKTPADAIPFIEEDEDYFMNKYISVLPINNLDTLSIDASHLPAAYLIEGVEPIKESFSMRYQMEGGKRVLNSAGSEILTNIILSNGKEAPVNTIGESNVLNFRHFYYHFGSVMMYSGNLKQYIEEIEKVDLTSPHLTMTYSIYDTDRTHEMNFYFFDDAGIWSFYTLDGEGRYLVRTEDLLRMVKGAIALRDGLSVTEILGPIG